MTLLIIAELIDTKAWTVTDNCSHGGSCDTDDTITGSDNTCLDQKKDEEDIENNETGWETTSAVMVAKPKHDTQNIDKRCLYVMELRLVLNENDYSGVFASYILKINMGLNYGKGVQI